MTDRKQRLLDAWSRIPDVGSAQWAENWLYFMNEVAADDHSMQLVETADIDWESDILEYA
jgi:hypothetical protein